MKPFVKDECKLDSWWALFRVHIPTSHINMHWPFQLEQSHGSVGRQHCIAWVQLHGLGVTFYRQFICTLLKVFIALDKNTLVNHTSPAINYYPLPIITLYQISICQINEISPSPFTKTKSPSLLNTTLYSTSKKNMQITCSYYKYHYCMGSVIIPLPNNHWIPSLFP